MNAEIRQKFRQLWGHSSHTHMRQIRDFSLDNPCQIRGCENRSQTRIMVNVWGTVFDLDTCTDCAGRFHGKCLEALPPLKQQEEKGAAT